MISEHSTSTGVKYWIHNDDSKLQVIILLHGLRGTHHGLEPIAKQLNGYKLIIPDLPGFGASKPLKNAHSIENYAIWLDSFIDELDYKKPIVFGHSFGTIIASCFAAQHSSKISKLLLINPVGSPPLEGERVIGTRISAAYYWLGRKLPEPFGTKILKSKIAIILMGENLAKTKDKSLMKFIHSEHLKHFNSFYDRKMVSEAFTASVTRNVRQYAKNITVPTLIIAGEIDDITALDKQKELAKIFPDAKLDIIKNVGHFTHYETPDEIVNSIKQFLS